MCGAMAQVSENSWQSLAPIHSSIKAPLGHHWNRKHPGALWGLGPAMAPKHKSRHRPVDSTPPRRVRSRQSETIERVTPEKAPEPGLASQAAASARAGQSAALAANAASGHAVEEVPIGSHWSEDEKFAARGLSIKSFAFQIPDLWSFVACLERFVDVYTNRQYVIGEEGAPLETVMSRVAVVLRIIRGAGGILWATKKLESSLLKDITSAEPTHKVLHTVGGRLLAEWKQLVAHFSESLVQDISSWELVSRWRMPPQYLLINGLILWFPG